MNTYFANKFSNNPLFISQNSISIDISKHTLESKKLEPILLQIRLF